MIGDWNLLIIGRAADDAERVVQILRNHGMSFEWRLACSAASLQQALREWTCDLVLCDFNIPGFDVESVKETLKAAARLEVPLIIMSDSVGEEMVADLMRRGAADFILKANLKARLAGAVKRELDNATARRQDQSAKQFNQRLFETSLDLILVTDRRGTFVRVNPISLELLGYRPDEMVGHGADEFIYPDDLENTRDEMRAGRRGRVTRHFECRYVRKDGGIVAFDWTGVWADPEQQHIFIGRDVTALKATESALRISEARLALAADIAQIGVASAEAAAAPTKTDAAFNRIYGRPETTPTMSAGEWLRLLHPDDRDQAAADLLAVVRQGGLFRGDFHIRRADTGQERWVRTVTRVAVDADGRPGQFLGVHTDITDIKSAIDTLIDREALLSLAMQIVGLGMATAETYDDLAQTDLQFRNIYGLRPDQTAIGVSDWFRLLHPDDRNKIAVTILRAIKGGEPYAGEFRFHRADTGEERWARALLRTVTNAAGRYGRSLSVHLDITEQKKAIEALHKSADQLNQAQQLANMGSTRVDLQSGDIEWSDQTYRIFGVTRGAYQPTMTNLFALVHPEDRDQFIQSREAVRQGRSPGPSEYRIRRPDGTVRYIHRENQVVRDARGEPRYLTGTLQDVTERRQIEEQLRQAQKMEALGNLTGGIAHDFNNMLGVIIGGLDFSLPMVGDNDEARELLQIALDAALSAADLTKGLLAFARQQPLRPERISVNRLITSLVRLLRRILGEDVPIALDLADDLCPVVVDAAQLEFEPDQSGRQRPRRDADRRPSVDHHRQPAPRRRVCREPRRSHRRRLCRHRSDRYRRRNAAGRAGARLRPVLHHQKPRQGHRSRAQHGVRLYQAVERAHQRLQRTWDGHDIPAVPALRGGSCRSGRERPRTDRPRRRAARSGR